MDLREKVAESLRQSLTPDEIRLVDDDGISGYIVSPRFRGLTAIDRQMLIENALRASPVKLTRTDRRRILAIAALTPAEHAALGE